MNLDAQLIFRVGSAVLFLMFYFNLVLNWKKYFLSGAFGGYAGNDPDLIRYHNPKVAPVILTVWFLANLGLLFGKAVVLSAFIHLVFSYYFFIRLRWKTLARGMGAPGFMTFWSAAAVFLLELTQAFAPAAHAPILLMIQLDLAWIMLSAGIYKVTAGYLNNDGFELGLVNPMWCYFWKLYRKMSPQNPYIFIMNQLAWSGEVLGALLMFFPETRALGGIVIALCFLFILTHIRLGVLCQQVILCCIVCAPAAYWHVPDTVSFAGSYPLELLLTAFAYTYIFLRPIVLLGMYYNFYGQKRLPQPIQTLLEKYTNTFGIILWRVFTADVVRFYVEIYHKDKKTGDLKQIAYYDKWLDWRFNQVTECIAVTTIFTALKYFSDGGKTFENRITQYCKTLPSKEGSDFYFKYMVENKIEGGYEFIHSADFLVDEKKFTVSQAILNEKFAPTLGFNASAAHNCVKPGSYAPA